VRLLALPIGATWLQGGGRECRLHLPARRRRWTRQADADCGQLRARQRRCSVLHGHHLPDAGHCFFINRETTKVLGVTLTAEQSAKIFKSIGAGFERFGTGAIAEVVLLNQILVDTSGTQANLELSANHLSQAFAPTPASSPNAGNRNGCF
jgi:hypothetical protein